LMAGTVLHTGRQATSGPDRNLYIADILLKAPINGETYVMRLKDLTALNVSEYGAKSHISANTLIGQMIGSIEPKAEAGLHVTLLKLSDYPTYAMNVRKPKKNPLLPSGNAIGMFMSAAHDVNSPFRCP